MAYNGYLLIFSLSLLMKVGCDGLMASGAQVDRCGVCIGNGQSCRTIAGIYTRRELPRAHDYNFITRIPAGACNINITEMARSRNFLSLKITNGSSVINGNFRQSPRGRFRAAGTTFTHGAYSGYTCPGHCIMAPGPTTMSIDVELLFYTKNPGIKYQFTIPKELMQNVFKTVVPSSHSRNQLNRNSNTRNNHRINSQRTSSAKTRVRIIQRPVFEASVHVSPSIYNDPLETGNMKNGQHLHHRTLPRMQPDRHGPDEDEYRSQYRTYPRSYPRGGNRQPLVGRTIVKQSVLSQFPNNEEQGNHIYVDNSVPKLSAQNIPDSVNYYWRLSGFTECTEKCGGGTQETRVICMKRNSNVIVTEDNCDPNLRPATQTISCNIKICPPKWDSANWTECSVSCGVGMQTRQVLCKQKISPQLHITMHPKRCASEERPESARSCKQEPCASWLADQWGECSANCGRGEKTRKVHCKSLDGGTVPEDQCEGIKPENKAICDMGSCAQGWFHTRWSETCSNDCGKGYRTRTVYCSAADGTPLSETKCSKNKPRERKRCQNKKPCGGTWFEGPWSECTATCGEGKRKRDIVCMKKLGNSLFAVVKPENCQGADKPITEESCGALPACPSEWYITTWSQCSATCETGVKTREVKCLDSKLQPSTSCPSNKRPSRRRTCNTQSCELPQLDQDPHCSDKLKICHLVAQARLCHYLYYNNHCCQTCTIHRHKSHHRSHQARRQHNQDSS